MLGELRDELDQMAEDEHEKYDAIPESLQESARGMAFDEAAEYLEDWARSVGDAVDGINEYI